MEFTHLYIPSLCKEFFVMHHNLGHSTTAAPSCELKEFLKQMASTYICMYIFSLFKSSHLRNMYHVIFIRYYGKKKGKYELFVGP